MSVVTDQLERDAAFMKVLPSVFVYPNALIIDEVEANRISNNLAQAAREIERLERECDRYRKHNALNERIELFFTEESAR